MINCGAADRCYRWGNRSDWSFGIRCFDIWSLFFHRYRIIPKYIDWLGYRQFVSDYFHVPSGSVGEVCSFYRVYISVYLSSVVVGCPTL